MADPFFDSLNKSIDNVVPLAMKKWEIDQAAERFNQEMGIKNQMLDMERQKFDQEVSKIAQRNKFKEAVTKMMQPQPVTSVDPQAAASTAAMPEGAFSVKPDLLPSITTMKTPDIDPRKILMAGLENTGEPEYAKQLVELAKVKDQRPITLAPGGVAINPVTGLPMFSNPAKKERPISVAPGGSAVDPVTGEIIYTSPAKPQRPITVAPGGVVVDPDTLQPQYTNPNKTAADKPPIGYRATPDGNLEPVPGGPADFKKQQQFTKDTAALEGINADLDRLGKAAKALKDHPGLPRITGILGKIPNIPGSAAADAEGLLGTLKSQTAFSVLQTMRNNSKTGGALGQVSDKEGQLLQDNLAALDKAQSTKAYQEALQQIIDYTAKAKERTTNAYDLKWAENAPNSNQKRFDIKVPQAAIDYLKKHPDQAAAFDAKYGNGNKVSQHFLRGK